MEIKTKLNKWDIIKIKSFCTMKEGKRTPLRMGENNRKQNNCQIINLQIYKQLKQLNTRKTSNPIKMWAEDLNRHFSIEDIQMANKPMKRCPTAFIFREMQIKTTMRYHLMLVRMAVIKVYKQ